MPTSGTRELAAPPQSQDRQARHTPLLPRRQRPTTSRSPTAAAPAPSPIVPREIRSQSRSGPHSLLVQSLRHLRRSILRRPLRLRRTPRAVPLRTSTSGTHPLGAAPPRSQEPHPPPIPPHRRARTTCKSLILPAPRSRYVPPGTRSPSTPT